MTGEPHAPRLAGQLDGQDGWAARRGQPHPLEGPEQPTRDPQPIGDPEPTSTDPRVADALSRLVEADQLPLAEQVAVYTDIHRRLAGVLADPDSQA